MTKFGFNLYLFNNGLGKLMFKIWSHPTNPDTSIVTRNNFNLK